MEKRQTFQNENHHATNVHQHSKTPRPPQHPPSPALMRARGEPFLHLRVLKPLPCSPPGSDLPSPFRPLAAAHSHIKHLHPCDRHIWLSNRLTLRSRARAPKPKTKVHYAPMHSADATLSAGQISSPTSRPRSGIRQTPALRYAGRSGMSRMLARGRRRGGSSRVGGISKSCLSSLPSSSSFPFSICVLSPPLSMFLCLERVGGPYHKGVRSFADI